MQNKDINALCKIILVSHKNLTEKKRSLRKLGQEILTLNMTTTFRKRSCKTHFCSFGYSDIIKGAIFTKSKVIKSSYPHAFSYDLIKPKHNEINFKERFKSCG